MPQAFTAGPSNRDKAGDFVLDKPFNGVILLITFSICLWLASGLPASVTGHKSMQKPC